MLIEVYTFNFVVVFEHPSCSDISETSPSNCYFVCGAFSIGNIQKMGRRKLAACGRIF